MDRSLFSVCQSCNTSNHELPDTKTVFSRVGGWRPAPQRMGDARRSDSGQNPVVSQNQDLQKDIDETHFLFFKT
jgi:hypothetical protein